MPRTRRSAGPLAIRQPSTRRCTIPRTRLDQAETRAVPPKSAAVKVTKPGCRAGAAWVTRLVEPSRSLSTRATTPIGTLTRRSSPDQHVGSAPPTIGPTDTPHRSGRPRRRKNATPRARPDRVTQQRNELREHHRRRRSPAPRAGVEHQRRLRDPAEEQAAEKSTTDREYPPTHAQVGERAGVSSSAAERSEYASTTNAGREARRQPGLDSSAATTFTIGRRAADDTCRHRR